MDATEHAFHAWAREGDNVVCAHPFFPPDGTGYLYAAKGDEFRVLYVGSSVTRDLGWLFAQVVRRCNFNDDSDPGDAIDTWLKVGDMVQCAHSFSPPNGKGYLSAVGGDQLRVLYVGSSVTQELGWVFAEIFVTCSSTTASSPEERCSPQGWFPMDRIASHGSKQKGWIPSTKLTSIEFLASSSSVLSRTANTVSVPCLPSRRGGVPSFSDTQLPQLRLITFGVSNCDYVLRERWLAGVYEFEEQMLRDALSRHGEHRVDIILDARRFPDPERHGTCDDRYHSGMHPSVISRIVYHHNFQKYLRYVKHIWKRWRASGPDLVVALYCRSGKHRSVAIAECLRRIAGSIEGMCVADVIHLSKCHWQCFRRGTCAECSEVSPRRCEAFQRVEQLWNAAG